MSFLFVDYSFFDTFQVPLVAGRNFQATDHHFDFRKITNLVLNEHAVKLLGIADPKDAIGQSIAFWDLTCTIVGVVSDFHQQALKNPIEPMLFFPAYSEGSRISIRMQSDNFKETLTEVDGIFKKFFPGNPFEYFFLEDSYKRQYRDDNRFGKVVSIFTVLAIIISCLGLIGLSSYTAMQRTKEIGIRKVLGASLFNIVSLLSVDFLKLIVLATVLSLPVSYFALQNWLEIYAYRIPLGWMLFGVPVVMILLIAAVTMSFHVMKTAMTNPADTLKYE
jgi:putative ABC transport system permease protein